jgi:HEAT repeat protein
VEYPFFLGNRNRWGILIQQEFPTRKGGEESSFLYLLFFWYNEIAKEVPLICTRTVHTSGRSQRATRSLKDNKLRVDQWPLPLVKTCFFNGLIIIEGISTIRSYMIKILKISSIIFLFGSSLAFAQTPEDTLFQKEPQDTIQADSTQQRLDVLFARASGGVVGYEQSTDSSKKALISMRERAVPYIIDKLGSKDVREVNTGMDVLKGIGDPAVPYLIQTLADTNNSKIGTVVRTLGEMKAAGAVMPLANMVRNEDFRIRSNACTALGLIGDTSAVDYLIPALNDTANLVRKSAAFALGEARSHKSMPYLISALSDEFYGTRFTASNSLVKFGAVATKSLIPLLNAQDLNLRCLVIETLGKIKDKKALEPLLVNLTSPDWAVRGFTVEALGNIGNGKTTKAIKDLEKTEEHPFVKKKIEEALEKVANTIR